MNDRTRRAQNDNLLRALGIPLRRTRAQRATDAAGAACMSIVTALFVAVIILACVAACVALLRVIV